MERNSELHCRIRNLRNEKNLTQKQVANYLGIEVSRYAHYEKGDRTTNSIILNKLAELYNTDAQMLGAKYPIEAFVSYDVKDIEKLQDALNNCKWIKGDYQHNQKQYNELKAAIKPILEARDAALELPEININQAMDGQTVLIVRLDRLGEKLIDRYLEESSKFFDMI